MTDSLTIHQKVYQRLFCHKINIQPLTDPQLQSTEHNHSAVRSHKTTMKKSPFGLQNDHVCAQAYICSSINLQENIIYKNRSVLPRKHGSKIYI